MFHHPLIRFCCALLFAIAGTQLFAQTPPVSASSPEQKAGRYAALLTHELALSGGQREAVYALQLDFLLKQAQIFDEQSRKGGDSMPYRIKLRELSGTRDRLIRDCLDPKQAEQFNAWLARERAAYSRP